VSSGHSSNREQFYEQRACAETDRYPDKDPASVRLLLNLIGTFDVAERLLARRLAPHGLSPSSFNVLMILRQHPEGCAMSAMSDLLLVSRANITGLIDSLEERGLVQRTACVADRRSKMGTLTEAGRKLLEEMLPDHYAYIRSMLEGFPEDEKSQLTVLLARMRSAMQAFAPEVGE
jgi:MarR family transcriptional regulator, 2-MHQ and catechol-resistance regulon repressor